MKGSKYTTFAYENTSRRSSSQCTFRIWSSKVQFERPRHDMSHRWNYGTIQYFISFKVQDIVYELAYVDIYQEKPPHSVSHLDMIDVNAIRTDAKYIWVKDIDAPVIFGKTLAHVIEPESALPEQKNIRFVLLAMADKPVDENI